MAEFGTIPFQKIALQRFWRGLVDAATTASADGAKHKNIHEPACVSDIETWIYRLIPELQSWSRTHQKLPDLNSRIRLLRKLPNQISGCKEEKAKIDLIKRLTSVSLFRLRPFRRTMLWDRYHNSFLPEAYTSARVENMEASLPSGEAAFVAFAGGCAAYQTGIVIGDCKEDLRSTYPLIDRTIGLRSNAIVPIRQQAKDAKESQLGTILALIMVSLPFANAYTKEFASRLTKAFIPFEDQVELMWEFEQLRETHELDEKDYPPKLNDEFRQLILDLTPDAYAGPEGKDDPARLPGCAILVGEASGGGQMAASVEISSAQVAISPQREALFAQTELELGSYGVKDRWFTPEDLFKVGTLGVYSLWYGPREDRRAELPESLEPFKVLQIIGDAAALAFKRGGKASLMHRRLDTQRLLFSYTLDYLASGHSTRLAAIINEIRAIYASIRDQIDLDQIAARLDEMREWVVRQGDAPRFLCVSIDAPVLALNYTAEETYLSGFRGRRAGETSLHSLSKKIIWSEHSHFTDVAHELSGVRRFIALCRALSAFVLTTFPGDGAKTFKIKNFGIYSSDSPKQAHAYLPSTLLSHKSLLSIERLGNSVNIKIKNNDGCLLESNWQVRNGFLPLATSALAPLTPKSKPLHLQLTGLPLKEQVLFFDIRRARISPGSRPWRVNSNTKCRPVANLVQLLAKEMPDWAASMDRLAVVPLPHREGFKRPSFLEWAQGRGKRRLLVAGILRRTVEPDVWSDWDIDLVSDSNPPKEDPFLERFWNLLNGVQHRQSILRQIEKLKQNETIIAHLSHDLCSQENIEILQKVLNLQELILRPHRSNAPDFKPQDVDRHVKELAEAQVISHDLNLLRVLASLDSNVVYPPTTLATITSALVKSTVSAIRHAARRITRTSPGPVYDESLADLLITDLLDVANLKKDLRKIRSEVHVSPDLVFIHALLDNVLRNAFEGAWSFSSGSPKGTVKVQQRPEHSSLVVSNDAEPGRWERMEALYNTATAQHLGITIIRSIAERLNVGIVVKVNSATNGEIQLIVER